MLVRVPCGRAWACCTPRAPSTPLAASAGVAREKARSSWPGCSAAHEHSFIHLQAFTLRGCTGEHAQHRTQPAPQRSPRQANKRGATPQQPPQHRTRWGRAYQGGSAKTRLDLRARARRPAPQPRAPPDRTQPTWSPCRSKEGKAASKHANPNPAAITTTEQQVPHAAGRRVNAGTTTPDRIVRESRAPHTATPNQPSQPPPPGDCCRLIGLSPALCLPRPSTRPTQLPEPPTPVYYEPLARPCHRGETCAAPTHTTHPAHASATNLASKTSMEGKKLATDDPTWAPHGRPHSTWTRHAAGSPADPRQPAAAPQTPAPTRLHAPAALKTPPYRRAPQGPPRAAATGRAASFALRAAATCLQQQNGLENQANGRSGPLRCAAASPAPLTWRCWTQPASASAPPAAALQPPLPRPSRPVLHAPPGCHAGSDRPRGPHARLRTASEPLRPLAQPPSTTPEGQWQTSGAPSSR
jgi:hypothetical protein